MTDEFDRASDLEEKQRAEALARTVAKVPKGASAIYCDDCGEPIPEKRRRALPGVRTCMECQSLLEAAIKRLRN